MNQNNHLKLTIFIFLFIYSRIEAQDTLTCFPCDLHEKVKLLKTIQSFPDWKTKDLVFYDSNLSLSAGIIMQSYLQNKPLLFGDGNPSVALYGKKHYKKVYHELKSSTHIRYIGMAPENDFYSAINVVWNFTDSSLAKSSGEIYVYNTLSHLALDWDEEIELSEKKELFYYILNYPEYLNLFTDKEIVLKICKSLAILLENPVKTNDKMNEKIKVVLLR